MVELRGSALLAAVTTLTSLGFLMIGYDNGLFGGLGIDTLIHPGLRLVSADARMQSTAGPSTRPLRTQVRP